MARKHGKTLKVCLVIGILFVFKSKDSQEAEICEMIDECSCKKGNGKIINLRYTDGANAGRDSSAIAFKSIPLVNAGGRWPFVYDWNPCTKFSEGENCKDVQFCERYSAVPDLTNPCASNVSHFTVQNDGSTVLTYLPVIDSTPKKRIVHITLKCDENVFPGNISGIDGYWPSNPNDYITVIFNATFTSRCACDDGCVDVPDPPLNPGSSDGAGLGTGSYIIIGFFALIFVYLIGGTAINACTKGVKSDKTELLPNYELWSALPSLVKAGVVYSCGGLYVVCCSLCQRCKKDGYDNLESKSLIVQE